MDWIVQGTIFDELDCLVTCWELINLYW